MSTFKAGDQVQLNRANIGTERSRTSWKLDVKKQRLILLNLKRVWDAIGERNVSGELNFQKAEITILDKLNRAKPMVEFSVSISQHDIAIENENSPYRRQICIRMACRTVSSAKTQFVLTKCSGICRHPQKTRAAGIARVMRVGLSTEKRRVIFTMRMSYPWARLLPRTALISRLDRHILMPTQTCTDVARENVLLRASEIKCDHFSFWQAHSNTIVGKATPLGVSTVTEFG
jgi:hypothetical protein